MVGVVALGLGAAARLDLSKRSVTVVVIAPQAGAQ